jgi:Trk-type K+ transport system membrane component
MPPELAGASPEPKVIQGFADFHLSLLLISKFSGLGVGGIGFRGRSRVSQLRMRKTLLICVFSFVAGAVATAAPFLIAGHFAHLDEAARGEPTMGPGITTFLGLLLSPIGGIVAVVVTLWLLRRKSATVEPPE